MSQNDNFAGGFIAGALLGGVVGGIIGALATARLKSGEGEDTSLSNSDRFDSFSPGDEESMERARRGLEDKIAQLNSAIDDVRQQLGGINGHAQPVDDPSMID
ncbi:hypothetical protein C7271_19805 [filamentous cyanobacterium CCP5]|nr:hypothetical protein C7271_19805 [filamentous cyanobacterium CCP5]